MAVVIIITLTWSYYDDARLRPPWLACSWVPANESPFGYAHLSMLHRGVR